MLLSEVLGLRVVDAGSHPLGTVVDVRVTIAGELADDPPTPRVLGLVVSPHTRSSVLGYERSAADAPAMIAALTRCRHRGPAAPVCGACAGVGASCVAG